MRSFFGDAGGDTKCVGGDFDVVMGESIGEMGPGLDVIPRPPMRVAPGVKPSSFTAFAGRLPRVNSLISIKGFGRLEADRAARLTLDLEVLRLERDDMALPGRRGARRVARGASSSESELDEDEGEGARPLGCTGGGMDCVDE